jgi:hypothetical protein
MEIKIKRERSEAGGAENIVVIRQCLGATTKTREAKVAAAAAAVELERDEEQFGM